MLAGLTWAACQLGSCGLDASMRTVVTTLMDTPDFPQQYRARAWAEAHLEELVTLLVRARVADCRVHAAGECGCAVVPTAPGVASAVGGESKPRPRCAVGEAPTV